MTEQENKVYIITDSSDDEDWVLGYYGNSISEAKKYGYLEFNDCKWIDIRVKQASKDIQKKAKDMGISNGDIDIDDGLMLGIYAYSDEHIDCECGVRSLAKFYNQETKKFCCKYCLG